MYVRKLEFILHFTRAGPHFWLIQLNQRQQTRTSNKFPLPLLRPTLPINLHRFLRGKCCRSIWPLGVADDAHGPVERRHIECGEHVQHRSGEDKAHDPDDDRYAQRGPLAHSRPQGIHDGHVPTRWTEEGW